MPEILHKLFTIYQRIKCTTIDLLQTSDTKNHNRKASCNRIFIDLFAMKTCKNMNCDVQMKNEKEFEPKENEAISIRAV